MGNLIATWILLLSCGVVLQWASAWDPAHATYYGGADGGGTNNGACGYGEVFHYGVMTTALSTPLFNNGATCGTCFQIKCIGDPACHNNMITVTATNFCPHGSNGGWCDDYKYHFDLTEPAFSMIAWVPAGHVPLEYRKVKCVRTGGVYFQIMGKPYFFQTLIYNVAGDGDVTAMFVKGSSTNWIFMSRDWGQIWKTGVVLDGQALSFMVRTSDGRTVTSYNVAGSNWKYGQTFEGAQF